MFTEVVQRFLRMGAGQFLRDYRRTTKLKKAMAHRKTVLQRKQKAKTKSLKVHIPQIQQDRTPFKQTSHGRLITLLEHSKERGMQKIYTKMELMKLCSAYAINVRTSWNKSKLMQELASAIRANTNIPSPQLINEYTICPPAIEDRNAVPRVRIRVV